MNKYVGLLYDELTPEVGAKIIQDVIAMLTITQLYRLQLVLCSPNIQKLGPLLSQLPVDVSTEISLPKLFIAYKIGTDYPEAPDNCKTLVTRDLSIKEKQISLDLVPHNGHPLKNFRDRISYSNMNRIWNHPNGYAPPDAAMIMLWGPVKG